MIGLGCFSGAERTGLNGTASEIPATAVKGKSADMSPQGDPGLLCGYAHGIISAYQLWMIQKPGIPMAGM